jgi:hypothetical protein
MTRSVPHTRSWRDAGFLLLVTPILLLATWPFFGAFAVAAVAAGSASAMAMRSWHDRHPGELPSAGHPSTPWPELNVSAIQVGGDAGGLVFVAGTALIFIVSMPSLRWFLLYSIAAACALAFVRVAWRRTHAAWSTADTSIRPDARAA